MLSSKEPEQPTKATEGFGMGDKVVVFHERKTEEGKTIEKIEVTAQVPLLRKLLEAALTEKFCFECGSKLTPLLILVCENDKCKSQFLAQFDEKIGKLILTPLGEEEKL